MLRLNQIKVSVTGDMDELKRKISKLLKTEDFTIKKIVKKSIDARDKTNLLYIYSVDVETKNENRIIEKNKKANNNNIMSTTNKRYIFPHDNNLAFSDKKIYSPVIIGAGPAGYFCGLYLARQGYKPIIIEQGKPVHERSKDVEGFWQGKNINPNSNVSFGEGGAGTFSDGKLNTGIKDKMGRITAVVEDFIQFGAPEDIGYLNKPHIGTDELKNVLYNMRQEIISLGGRIHFNTKFIDYNELSKEVYEVLIEPVNMDSEFNELTKLKTSALILAIGHSSRDTFAVLANKNIPMEPKSYAIGVRIEHPSEMIDEAQYGSSEAAKTLPAADYKMTFRSSEGRSVYSFCMCPGGFVVNASSDVEQSVVNGMSNHSRDERNSNSAIVVNVTLEDFIAEGFGGYGVLAGVEFQKKYEKLAYIEGEGKIPVQTFGDYKAGKTTEKLGEIKPNIKGDYRLSNLNNCLPVYVNNAIIEGISYYDGKLKGFARDDSVLSGIESRTSSPVRIIRQEDTLMSEQRGIFPCGEGAGYAGGITSAAVDGIKIAEAVAIYLNSI